MPYEHGIQALANGDFTLRLPPGAKETWGIIDGKAVLLLWDVAGHNPRWKQEAIQAYQDHLRGEE